jgi:peptidoglycan hydrolase-like protein with peptidoglycan-binding domain
MPYGSSTYGGTGYGGLSGDDPWVEADVFVVDAVLTVQHPVALAGSLSDEFSVSADLTGHYAAPLAGSIDVDVTFDATSEAGLSSWHSDDSGKLNLDVFVVANLTAPPKPAAPPPIPGTSTPMVVNFERISWVYPAPALDAMGLPVNWQPTSTVREDWGRYQIVVDGVDVTFFRGFPTLMGSMAWNEPFGDNTLDITFPQVGPWEVPGAGAITWMRNGVDVEVWHVRPDGSRGPVIFEGRALVRETNVSARSAGGGEGHGGGSEQTDFGKTLHVLGAIYAADLVIKTPSLAITNDPANQAADIGQLISTELNNRSSAGMIHLGPCGNVVTGIEVASKGSGNQLINGYVQDLLGQGSVVPLPSPGAGVVGLAVRPDGGGYWVTADDGTVVAFGTGTFYGGSMVGRALQGEIAGMDATPSGHGYWLVGVDGGVFAFGDAGFYGSAVPYIPAGWTVVGIARTPSGRGYWLVTDTGAIYAFGDAVYHGGGPGASDIVAIAAHPTGSGYWLLDSTGHVYSYGDCGYHGGVPIVSPTVGIAATASGNGYWIVDEAGHVYAFGDAGYHGNTPDPINQPASDIAPGPGGGYIISALDGGIFIPGNTSTFYGSIPGNNGEWQGWTLSKYPGRRPVVELKNRWQVHATVRAGQPGVALSLQVDQTTATTVIYGDGTDSAGHAWRNTKYPNLRPLTPPLWPGVTLKLGTVHSSVQTWSQAMHDAGWRIDVGTTFDGSMQNAARAFQLANGLEVTGTVGAQTWAATFVTGANNGDLTAAYVSPLAERIEVDPYVYDAFGAVLGPNPKFDRSVVRVERWETFGEGVEKTTADLSAMAEIARDSRAAVVGTVTLTADPNEMSRYDLRAGMNLLLQGYEGRDVLLHIAGVSTAWNSQGRPVTLTVDEHARDMLTVAAIRARDRSVTDPVRRLRHNRRASRIVPDRAVPWDFEAGGGIIPRFVLAAGLWSVVRIPAASAGTVVQAILTTESPATKFAVAVFNQPVTPANIKPIVPNPLAVTDWATGLAGKGLVVAWGQQGQGEGYYPGSEDAGGTVTGQMNDSGSWQFQSLVPPWLWVAIFSPVQTIVSGRLYPQPVTNE